MSWAIGWDSTWYRDIGYGVPAWCDQPDCTEQIDRGLGYVCGYGLPYGGDAGCGLYFCGIHGGGNQCERCAAAEGPAEDAFPPKPDHPEWINHKLTDESWQDWRDREPGMVALMREQVAS